MDDSMERYLNGPSQDVDSGATVPDIVAAR
jgi:trimethylamine monooxygenase